MFNLFSFSKIGCSLKTNSLIGEWQDLTGGDPLLCYCSTVNTLEKNLPNSSALSLFELTVVELPEISTICKSPMPVLVLRLLLIMLFSINTSNTNTIRTQTGAAER